MALKYAQLFMAVRIAEAFSLFDPAKTTLLGNIHQIDLLRNGSHAQIKCAVEGTLQATKAWKGNFILVTTDYFNENTRYAILTPSRRLPARAAADSHTLNLAVTRSHFKTLGAY